MKKRRGERDRKLYRNGYRDGCRDRSRDRNGDRSTTGGIENEDRRREIEMEKKIEVEIKKDREAYKGYRVQIPLDEKLLGNRETIEKVLSSSSSSSSSLSLSLMDRGG